MTLVNRVTNKNTKVLQFKNSIVMKTKLILCALLFSASTLLLNAQPPRQHNRANQQQGQGQVQNREMLTPEARADRMAKHLELTDAQKAKVLELFKEEDAKMKAMREEVKANREKGEKLSDAQREKFAAERKAHEEELSKIVGAEKYAKLQAERQVQMQKIKEKRANMRSNNSALSKNPMNRPEARAKRVEKIKENFTPEKRAERLKMELNLTDAEKDALVQLFNAEKKKIAEERKQHFEATKKSHDAEMEKIIGKEKMAKYKELQNSKVEKIQKNRKVKKV